MTPNHQSILALARAGNPVRAWALFNSSGLKDARNDPKVLTLKGRLLKDLARRATGDERARLYSRASDAYLAANALGEDSYPLINAAALACFAGDHARSARIARDVLTLIENDAEEGETAYWREATRAEAHLLLREIASATAALALAYKKLPFAHEDQAATLGQFDRILEAQGEDAAWLEPFRVPCSVNFAALESETTISQGGASTTKAIASALEELAPGYGFGGLLTPADLLFAEEVLECGGELCLAFPFEPDDIARSAFAPLGNDWERRFHTVLEQAGQVELLPCAISETPLSQDAAKSVTQLVAMGQSLRRSEALRSRAHALVLSDKAGSKPASLNLWSKASLPIYHLGFDAGHDAGHDGGRDRGHAGGHQAPPDLCGLCGLCGMVMTSDAQALAPFAAKHGLEAATHGKANVWKGTLETVVAATMDCSNETDAVLAVHLGHPASQPVWEGLSERMERLTRADHAAKVKMGIQSAMIAKIVRPSLRIEELGEIQTLSGHASIWSAVQ